MNCGLESYINDRRGRLCRIPQLNLHSRTSVQSLREASFQVHGPRLFNKLPKNIRNLTNCSVDDFKSKLDQFLENIPDEPRVSNLVPTASSQVTARASNSLLEQIKTADQITGGQIFQPSEIIGVFVRETPQSKFTTDLLSFCYDKQYSCALFCLFHQDKTAILVESKI